MKQRGFTLIEVLVTMVVLAVGLVGIAGLQAQSLRNSQDSYFKMQANNIANDIAERLRANSAAAISNPSSYTVKAISEIAANLEDSKLPNGKISITPTDISAKQKLYTIIVQWSIDGAQSGNCGSPTVECFYSTVRIGG